MNQHHRLGIGLNLITASLCQFSLFLVRGLQNAAKAYLVHPDRTGLLQTAFLAFSVKNFTHDCFHYFARSQRLTLTQHRTDVKDEYKLHATNKMKPATTIF